MSAWIILVRELHAIGGSGRRAQFDAAVADQWGGDGGIQQAKRLGLVSLNGSVWALTDKGRDFCEGRIKPKGRRGGIRFEATWLKSFPAGVQMRAEPHPKPSESAELREWLAA